MPPPRWPRALEGERCSDQIESRGTRRGPRRLDRFVSRTHSANELTRRARRCKEGLPRNLQRPNSGLPSRYEHLRLVVLTDGVRKKRTSGVELQTPEVQRSKFEVLKCGTSAFHQTRTYTPQLGHTNRVGPKLKGGLCRLLFKNFGSSRLLVKLLLAAHTGVREQHDFRRGSEIGKKLGCLL